MMAFLERIPNWVVVVALSLLFGACEDVRRFRCEDAGKRWIKGTVIDLCREPKK